MEDSKLAVEPDIATTVATVSIRMSIVGLVVEYWPILGILVNITTTLNSVICVV